MGKWMRILGIDPGSRVTGYGLIDSDGTATRYVASGCIRTESGELAPRLQTIFEGVRSLVCEYRPGEIAIEKVFLHRNADSALKLGQARSAAICATFTDGVAVHEYAARAVKQAVVGSGGADKPQVQHMVRALLRLSSSLAPDEADALAVALCHAHSRPLAARFRVVAGLAVVRR
jgi:crossover junction endodeoxyribonuclease RuvC